jgi:hypothetical protein
MLCIDPLWTDHLLSFSAPLIQLDASTGIPILPFHLFSSVMQNDRRALHASARGARYFSHPCPNWIQVPTLHVHVAGVALDLKGNCLGELLLVGWVHWEL